MTNEAVLEQIIQTRTVTDGTTSYPLQDEMDPAEGELIRRAFRAVKPTTSIEVGMAYGVSTLYACGAIRAEGIEGRHIVLDPYQIRYWRSIGLRNLHEAGYGDLVDLRTEGSEIGLPKLLAEGVRCQAAIIDGYHTFDHALVDFFYINKMLDVGGVIVLDDTDWPAVAKCAEHILTYPAYELFEPGMPKAGTVFGSLRRALADRFKVQTLRRPYDYPSAMAFRKVAEDTRNFDWFEPF
jgi:predicted O-methyltransferase YrrM